MLEYFEVTEIRAVSVLFTPKRNLIQCLFWSLGKKSLIVFVLLNFGTNEQCLQYQVKFVLSTTTGECNVHLYLLL